MVCPYSIKFWNKENNICSTTVARHQSVWARTLYQVQFIDDVFHFNAFSVFPAHHHQIPACIVHLRQSFRKDSILNRSLHCLSSFHVLVNFRSCYPTSLLYSWVRNNSLHKIQIMSDNVSKLIKFHDLLGLALTVLILSLEKNTFFLNIFQRFVIFNLNSCYFRIEKFQIFSEFRGSQKL